MMERMIYNSEGRFALDAEAVIKMAMSYRVPLEDIRRAFPHRFPGPPALFPGDEGQKSKGEKYHENAVAAAI